MTAALLYVLGHSENTTRDLRCFLEVPAGSGPRRFLLQSPGSGPNHTVHAQSVATAGPQGHHPAACRAHSPLPSQAACHTSPEPRVRVLKGRARTRESGSVLLGQACPAWHTCVCHACARTPPPSGPRGPLCVLGARASASPALVLLHAAPTPPTVRALDVVNMSFLFTLLKYLPSPFVSHLCLPEWGCSSRETEEPAGQPDTCPGLAQPRFLPTCSRSFWMLSCSLVGLTARPWPRGGGSAEGVGSYET